MAMGCTGLPGTNGPFLKAMIAVALVVVPSGKIRFAASEDPSSLRNLVHRLGPAVLVFPVHEDELEAPRERLKRAAWHLKLRTPLHSSVPK